MNFKPRTEQELAETNMGSVNAERIAKLVGHADLAANEAEAMAAWRLLRHEAAKAGVRIVDLLFRSDVIMALDKQLEPQRKGEQELIGKVKELSDLLAKEKEIFATAKRRALREQNDFFYLHKVETDRLVAELAAYRARFNGRSS